MADAAIPLSTSKGFKPSAMTEVPAIVTTPPAYDHVAA